MTMAVTQNLHFGSLHSAASRARLRESLLDPLVEEPAVVFAAAFAVELIANVKIATVGCVLVGRIVGFRQWYVEPHYSVRLSEKPIGGLT